MLNSFIGVSYQAFYCGSFDVKKTKLWPLDLPLEFFEILGVGYDTANQDTEGIEHHLNPKTIKQLRKFITFLKANPKIIDNFKNI